MYLTETHIINKKHQFYKEIDNLCFLSKNLYNAANYIVRQEFINSSGVKTYENRGINTLTTYVILSSYGVKTYENRGINTLYFRKNEINFIY